MSIPSFSNSKLLHFALFIALTAQSSLAAATAWENWFLNQDQQADRAFKQGDYEKAAELFTQPYQRGIALYRAEKYEEAAASFSQVQDPKQRIDAQYNLGNIEFAKNEFAKAIAQYESVLSQAPDHSKAQHNLELAKAKLKEQEQKQEQQTADSDSDSGENGEKSDSGDNSDKNNQNGQSDANQAGNPQENQQSKDSRESNESSPSAESSENSQNGQKSPDSTAAPPPESSPSEADKNGQQALQEQLEQALAEAQQQAQNDPKSAQTSETQQVADPSESDSAGKNGQITQTEAIPTGETTDTTKTTANLPQEQDLMADALLNQLLDDPGVLLKRQFQLDANQSQKMPSGQPW
jgi:Ca-activated chloride channel homolog